MKIADFRKEVDNKAKLFDICTEQLNAYLPRDEKMVSIDWLEMMATGVKKQVSSVRKLPLL